MARLLDVKCIVRIALLDRAQLRKACCTFIHYCLILGLNWLQIQRQISAFSVRPDKWCKANRRDLSSNRLSMFLERNNFLLRETVIPGTDRLCPYDERRSWNWRWFFWRILPFLPPGRRVASWQCRQIVKACGQSCRVVAGVQPGRFGGVHYGEKVGDKRNFPIYIWLHILRVAS